jgi:hypothetical protein
MLPVSPVKQETPEWVDKHEAAKRLGKSPSRVLGIAAEGLIQTKSGVDPKSGQRITLLHAGDIERLCYERDHPVTKAVVNLPAPIHSPAPEVRAATYDPHCWPCWLTLHQAAEYSGMTKRWLLLRAEASIADGIGGAAGIRDLGKHAPGGRWRFHRGDLEKA